MLITPRPAAGRGFTLIELMIGLAILSVLFAVGLPSFTIWMHNARIRNVSESILNGLQLARAEAVRRNAIVEFSLTGGAGWRVGCRVVTANCPASIQSRSANEGSSASITVAASDGSPIGFDNFGMMAYPTPAGGAAATRIDVDVDPALLPASQSKNMRVTVGVAGGVRMCDPNVADATDSRSC